MIQPKDVIQVSRQVTQVFGRFHGNENFLNTTPPEDVPKNVPWILHYTARFTSDMNDDYIMDIIDQVACMVNNFIDEYTGDNQVVVMFTAIYPSWDDDDRELWDIPEAGDLADRVVELGWGAIWAIPSAWRRGENINHLIGNTRLSPECRQRLAHETRISGFIRYQQAHRKHEVDALVTDVLPCILHFEEKLGFDKNYGPFA